MSKLYDDCIEDIFIKDHVWLTLKSIDCVDFIYANMDFLYTKRVTMGLLQKGCLQKNDLPYLTTYLDLIKQMRILQQFNHVR